MKRFSKALFGLALVASSVLAACGGGSHGVVPTPGKTTHQTGIIKATVHVPAAKTQNARAVAYAKSRIASHTTGKRKPDFLNGATTELDFTLETNNGSPVSSADQAAFDFTIYLQDSSECTPDGNGGYNCTVSYPAPVGTDTYNVSAYQCSVSGSSSSNSCQSAGGTLTLLSASYTSVNVQYNQTTVAAFTLSPVVASIDWAPVTYATEAGSGAMPSNLWLTQPNGTNIPKYTPSTTTYTCTYNAGSGTGNGCYEPVAKGYAIAYGEILEVRDPTGAIIIGASNNGTVYQTPVYLDKSGNAVSINWHCTDNGGGSSLTWETGNGPYTSNANATAANNNFNSPVANPAADPDGGNTTDANGNPVTAVGNNGVEMNWDGVDQPVLDKPDSCSASTSNGLTTSTLDFYAGLGEGGLTVPTPTPSPSPTPTPLVVANCPSYAGSTRLAPPASLTTVSASPPPGFFSFTSTSSDPDGPAQYMSCGPQKKLWILTMGQALDSYDPTSNAIAAFAGAPINTQLTTPGGDDFGDVYVNGSYNGSGQVTQYNAAAGSSSGKGLTISTPQGNVAVNFFITGADGNEWGGGTAGTPASGETQYMVRIQPNGASTTFAVPSGCEPDNAVVAPDGTMWIGDSYCGFVHFDPSTGVFTTHPIGTGRNTMTQIAMGADGALYGATLPSGTNLNTAIERYDPISGNLTQYPLPAEINYVISIVAGSDGNLWLSGAAATLSNGSCCFYKGGYVVRLNINTATMTEYSTTVVGTNNTDNQYVPSSPSVMVVGPDGNLYGVSGTEHNIMKIVPSIAGP
jgi:hypothetical protein